MRNALSTRLSLYFGSLLLAGLLTTLTIWWFGIPLAGEEGAFSLRQREIEQQLELRADYLRQMMMQSMAKRRNEVQALSANEALVRALNRPSDTTAADAVQHSVNAWLNMHPDDFQHVRIVHHDDSRIVASTNPAEIGAAFTDATLLARARRPGARELILSLTSPNSRPALVWVRQIHASSGEGNDRLIGWAIVYTEIQDLLQDTWLPSTSRAPLSGQTLLFGGPQQLLAAVPARDPARSFVRIDPEIGQGFEGSLVRTFANGEDYLTVFRTIPVGAAHHWTLVQVLPQSDILADMRWHLGRGLFVLLVMGLVFGSILWWVARMATRRLLSVSDAFGRLAAGEWTLRVPARTGDSLEIEALRQAFNHLAETVQRSHAGMEQLVAERTAELQAERDRAKGYLEVAGIMLAALDSKGRITLINRKGAELLGYPAAQLVGMDWFLHFVPSGQREQRRATYLRAMQGEYVLPPQEESAIVDANGHSRLITWHTVVLRDADGRPNGMLTSGQDVTSTRAAQAELRIAAIAFESQEPHMICDANWLILRVNAAFTEMTGYTAREAIGKLPAKLLGSAHTPPEFHLGLSEALQRQSRWQGEVWDRRKNGEEYPVWLQITAVRDDDQHVTHYVVSLNDITQRKSAEEQIRSLAFYDPLTNLPNRRMLMDRLEVALATCARHPRMGALLFVDLDNFKTLNDTMGHDIGDLLLQQVAERLKGCVREGDTVARLGGDEFVIMLEDLADDAMDAATQVEAVGEKILLALGRTYVLRGHTHRSTPSIGITLFGDRVEGIEEPLKRADVAMYQSKAAGRNTLRFFDPQMQAVVANRVALEAELRQAIEHGQLVLFYQPQVQTRSDGSLRVIGAEALVRWKHPQRGMVSPAEFIPLAEETGLIVPLGQWVMETACRQLAAWQGHPVFGNLSIAVNVSARQFMLSGFVAHVRQTLENTGAHPPKLKIELTESTLVGDMNEVIRKMAELQSWGVGFALDDFGTGYSSLAYLKRLPLDTLKIDQSFVRAVFEDANDAAIARMVVVLGRSLGLTVIAEGVETLEQRYFLAQQGCHVYQGYLFGRPAPAPEFQQHMLDASYTLVT